MGRSRDWTAVLRHAPLTVLRHKSTPLPRDGDTTGLPGMDDVLERKHDLDRTCAAVPPGARVILLVHEPAVAGEASRDRRVALQVPGQNHGGQGCLLMAGPPHLSHFVRNQDPVWSG